MDGTGGWEAWQILTFMLYLLYARHQTSSGSEALVPVVLLYLSLKQPQRNVRGILTLGTLWGERCEGMSLLLGHSGGDSQAAQSDQHCGNMVNRLTKAEGNVGA